MTTRNLAHLAARLYGVPLMVLPSVADSFGNTLQTLLMHRGGLIDVAAEMPAPARPQAFAANVPSDRFAEKSYLVTNDGVGVIPVYGVLLQRYAFDLASCSSFASYQAIRAQYDAMLADPDVKAVLFELDSPGGEVAGNFELARAMAAGAQASGKPVWSHANEGAYSAAYSLASATQRVVVPQAGGVGSIGVVMAHLDQSQRDAKQGVVWSFIYAGEYKVDGNSHQPLSDGARERAGAEVARLYDMFVGAVAQSRSIDAQVVRDTKAGLLSAGDAKAIGLVDDVASFDETLAEITAYARTPRSLFVGGAKAAATPVKGATMSQTNPAATTADPPQGVPENDVKVRETAAFAAGQKAERDRVNGIRAAALPGHEALVEQLAADGATTPEQAAMAVLDAERKAGAGAAAAHRADAPKPVPSGHAPDDTDKPKGAALGRAAVAAYNAFTTGKKGA